MKRILLLFSILMLSCIALWAHDVVIDGIYYYLDEYDNTAWVTYRGDYEDDYDDEYRGSVTIPETITYYSQSYSVTSIGSGAFYDCSKLTSVTIPNSVTYIGSDAFYNTGIYNNNSNWDNGVLYIDNCLIKAKSDVVKGSYTIKKGTRIIGDGAFYDCSGLTSVTIGESVTSIGYNAFERCSGLTSVTIPNSVTSIGEYAFSGCSSLTSVTIPNSVTSIGSNVFSYCSSLNSVTIPNSVTSIGEYAFEGCSGLTSITIPNTVTSIGSGAFYNTGIYNSESNWDNGVLYIDNCLIEAMSDVVKGSYTIKKGTRIIGPSAFEFCSGLTSVTIPNSVTSIGPSAFEYCSGLTSVSIGESVTSIGNNAFSGCSGLTSVTIPNSVTSIGYNAFYKCTGLTSVIWNAKNYKDIEVYDETPFYNICSSITSFTFGNEVEHIPAYLCYDMENLKEVTIGNSVTSIDEYAFSGCDKLIKVTTYPTTAPNAYESSFEHYNAYLYVPCDVYEDYDLDDVFGNFQYIKCITAEEDEPTSITETLADANITVSGGKISAEADFSIYNTIGQDVTAFNGSLQPGVYLVSIENDIVKVMVH